MRIPFLLVSIERASAISPKWAGIGRFLNRFFPHTQSDLEKTNAGLTPEKYFTAAFFSSLAYGFLLFVFLAVLFWIQNQAILTNIVLAGLLGALLGILFLFLHSIGPGIAAKEYASSIDKGLSAALNNMQIQVSSGVALFDAMANVAKCDYGAVSKEFETMVKEISGGESEIRALEKIVYKTKSEFLKKTCWQLLSALRSGAATENALATVVDSLSAEQFRGIRNYASELNLWILMYLLLATAVPTIGIAFLVILSAMAGTNLDPLIIVAMVVFAGVLQIVLIGFVKTRIPGAIA